MQRGSDTAHDHEVMRVNFDDSRYQALFKHVMATQEDKQLRDCKTATFSKHMQYVSPSSPLAVSVLILGDIIIAAQDEVVINKSNDSNNSIAVMIFILQVLELYALYLATDPQHASVWFDGFLKQEPERAEAIWRSMEYTTEHLKIDELNIDNMTMAAKWLTRFYAEIVGRYNVETTQQCIKAQSNRKAAAGLKQVVDTLNRKISLYRYKDLHKRQEENEETKLIHAHRQRIHAIPESAQVSAISDLPIGVVIMVIKAQLLSLSKLCNDPILSGLLQAFSALSLLDDEEILAKKLSQQVQALAASLKPLAEETSRRMKSSGKYWKELQLWLMGAAECIKLMNGQLKTKLLGTFTMLHQAVNYIDDALMTFYGKQIVVAGDRFAVVSELENLLHIYEGHLRRVKHSVAKDSVGPSVAENLSKTVSVLRLWRKLFGEYLTRYQDAAYCAAPVQVTSATSINCVRQLKLPEYFTSFMAAQHQLLNVLQHIELTDASLIHWAALAARLRVMTFHFAATNELGHELRSLCTVIAIALENMTIKYRECQRQQHSPLLAHHLHAGHDTAKDLPSFAECSVDFDFLAHPIICVLDGRSYSPAVLSWLNREGNAPMNRAQLGDQLPTAVLYPNQTFHDFITKFKALDAKGMQDAVLCPLSGKAMQDAAFCRLDNRTYSRKAFILYVTEYGETPGARPVAMQPEQVASVLCDDYNMQEAVQYLFPELQMKDDLEQVQLLNRYTPESGCCRIL